MKKRTFDGNGYRLAAGLLIAGYLVFLLAVGGLAYFLSQPRSSHYTCAGLGSYGSALIAFYAGAKYLDWNRDGKPCNALLTNDS